MRSSTDSISEKGSRAPDTSEALRFGRAIIERSLEADLSRVVGRDVAPSLSQVVKRVLVWWLDPRRDLRRGDQIDFVWSPVENEEPKALAVWLKSEKLKGERTAVLHQANQSPFPRWVNVDSGLEVESRLEAGPIRSYEQITSLLNDGRGHRGVDFKAPEGTPVFAPFAGEVVRLNWGVRGNGRCVKLQSRDQRIEALFLHLSRIASGLRVGTRLNKGDRIGFVGNTGHSFAPHLHYQLERNGRVIDPFRFHATWRKRLSEEERLRAKARLRELSSLRSRWD